MTRAAFVSKVGVAIAALSVCQRAHSINLTPAALTEKGTLSIFHSARRLDLLRRKLIFCPITHASFPPFSSPLSPIRLFSVFARAHRDDTKMALFVPYFVETRGLPRGVRPKTGRFRVSFAPKVNCVARNSLGIRAPSVRVLIATSIFVSRCGVNLSSCFPPRLFKCLSRRFIAARVEADMARRPMASAFVRHSSVAQFSGFLKRIMA